MPERSFPAVPGSRAPRQNERLRPALLDRLTDEQPTQRQETALPGSSHSALRAAVIRDLAWLLNTTSLAADVDLTPYAHALRSVLNYGVLPLAGKRISELDSQELATGLRLAILQFEPRLLPESVQVVCIATQDLLAHRNEMAFEIRALLWSVPYPLEFVVRSDLDLETGHTTLTDRVPH